MLPHLAAALLAAAAARAAAPFGGPPGFPAQASDCPPPLSLLRNVTNRSTVGVCPADLDVAGPELVGVHESQQPPTGIAVDRHEGVYLTYARNHEAAKYAVVKVVDWGTESPWPTEPWQTCAINQNASQCFVNVQNMVLDDNNQFWVLDSGVPFGSAGPMAGGPKIISFDPDSGQALKTFVVPEALWYDDLRLADLRISTTAGSAGVAFITDNSRLGSLLTVNLTSGAVQRHLYNTTVTLPDGDFLSMYNGQVVRAWNGTTAGPLQAGPQGIALAGGNVYWSVASSRRWYYVGQADIAADNVTDADLLAKVAAAGTIPGEVASMTADERGRLYFSLVDQNAILMVDTDQHEVGQDINGVKANTRGVVPTQNLDALLTTLVRSGLLQFARTMCVYNGWLYVTNTQEGLAPWRQYANKDQRMGPYRSFRVQIGRGPAPA